jgi:hypothetical protein
VALVLAVLQTLTQHRRNYKMYKYEVITQNTDTIIKRTDENDVVSWVPTDPANSDYQRYLKWLENPEAENITPTL